MSDDEWIQVSKDICPMVFLGSGQLTRTIKEIQSELTRIENKTSEVYITRCIVHHLIKLVIDGFMNLLSDTCWQASDVLGNDLVNCGCNSKPE
jgi:hypothetical protein